MQIASRDYWFKVVEMLQQNWALIEPAERGVTVFFLQDTSGVFDQLAFTSVQEAEVTLQRNGFRLSADDAEAQGFLPPPEPPFHPVEHPNDRIYSSGRLWR